MKSFIEGRLDHFLPRGSGIGCDWEYHWLKNSHIIIASNSIHYRDAHGWYDVYQDFNTKIDIFNLRDTGHVAFSLPRSEHCISVWKDRLDDYIQDALRSFSDSLEVIK